MQMIKVHDMRSVMVIMAIAVLMGHGGTALTAAEPALGSPDFVPSRARPFGWRGDGTGRFTGATRPPTKWNLATGENVRWKVPIDIRIPLLRKRIEGSPHKWNRVEGEITEKTKVSDWLEGTCSSPVLLDDRVITLSEPNWVFCVGKDDGKERWRRQVPLDRIDPEAAKYVTHHTGGYGVWRYGWTFPTPVTDNRFIWVTCGFGVVACFDRDGAPKWTGTFNVYKLDKRGQVRRKIPSPTLPSPALCRNPGGDGIDVLVTCGYDVDAFVGWNADTGERLWAVARRTENKICYQATATPAVMRLGGKTLLITVDGWVLDARTGTVLQKLFKLGGTVYSSPVVQGDVVVLESGSGKAVQAHRLSDQGTSSKLLWSWQPGGKAINRSAISSSLWMDAGVLVRSMVPSASQVLDPATGRLRFEVPLGSHKSGSPTRAGGLIYHIGTEAIILRPADQKSETIATFRSGFKGKPNHHGFGLFNSPVFEGSRMYFRDQKALYCIEQAQE